MFTSDSFNDSFSGSGFSYTDEYDDDGADFEDSAVFDDDSLNDFEDDDIYSGRSGSTEDLDSSFEAESVVQESDLDGYMDAEDGEASETMSPLDDDDDFDLPFSDSYDDFDADDSEL